MWNSYNLHIRFLPYRKSLHLLTQKAASNVQLGFVDSLLLSSLFLSPRTGRLNQYNRLLTWFISEWPPQASGHPNTSAAHAQQYQLMSQQRNVQPAYTEGDIILAISDITSNQIPSVKRAAEIYNVPQTTVRRRRAGQRSRRDCEPSSKRLTRLEEEAIVQRILDESLRGVPPSKPHVRDIADRLLRERGGKPIGKN
jgi:hypothetical protein